MCLLVPLISKQSASLTNSSLEREKNCWHEIVFSTERWQVDVPSSTTNFEAKCIAH